MRVFLQIFIPLGLFIAVLLTPIYLQRDLRVDNSDSTVEPQTEFDDAFSTTPSVNEDFSQATTDSQYMKETKIHRNLNRE